MYKVEYWIRRGLWHWKIVYNKKVRAQSGNAYSSQSRCRQDFERFVAGVKKVQAWSRY